MNKVDWLFITNEAINSGLVSRYLVDCRHSRRYGFSNKILKTIRKFISSSITFALAAERDWGLGDWNCGALLRK